MPAESIAAAGPIYYTEQNHSKIAAFEQSAEYEQFKNEYTSAIDATIEFYSNHETNNDYKINVAEGLNKFKKKLFDPQTGVEQQHILFRAKADMEQIEQALKPAEGEPPFGPSDITEKLIAIYNLAGDKELDTGQVGCDVCASGIAGNLADTAQLLSSGDLFDNVQTQRRGIVEDVIRQYVLSHLGEIHRRQGEGWHPHDTNLVNAFMNAFSKEWGCRSVTEIYVNQSIITAEDKENIDRELKRAVTQDSITDRLAKIYLEKIKENITISTDGTVDFPSATAAIKKFAKRYGDHSFESVFSVDENSEPIGITTDFTAIKVVIAQYFLAENKSRKQPADAFKVVWPEKKLIDGDGQVKKLWRIGDLFWIEQPSGYGKNTFNLPGINQQGGEYINEVGSHQLLGIIRQTDDKEGAAVLSKINPERLKAAVDAGELSLFFSKLDHDDGVKNAIAYVTVHKTWFEHLVAGLRGNPLIPLILSRLSGERRADFAPDIALQGITKDQSRAFFAALNSVGSIDKALAYASKHEGWFKVLVASIGDNPLVTVMLDNYILGFLSSAQLAAIPPDIALWGISADQARQFFASLDPYSETTKATAYATRHEGWFNTLLSETGGNPLATVILVRLAGKPLAKIWPDNIALRGINRRQARQFFTRLDPDGGVDNAIAYASTHRVWFNTLLTKIGDNPLTELILERLADEALAAIKPDNIALQGITIRQLRLFFAKMDLPGSITRALTYATEHQQWFNALLTGTAGNPLATVIMGKLSGQALADTPPDIVLRGITTGQAQLFFARLDPPGSTTRAVRYANAHQGWLKTLVARTGNNPLIGLILEHLSDEQLAAIKPDNIALHGITAIQAQQFFARLDPPGSITKALAYTSNHWAWFKALVATTGNNPLASVIQRDHISGFISPAQLAALSPDIALWGLSAGQARQFFASLDSNRGTKNAIAYATEHEGWFNTLLRETNGNPLATVILARLSGESLAAIQPDIALRSITALQAQQFFARLDSDGSIIRALAYATRHRTWFNTLAAGPEGNPLINLIFLRFSDEQLATIQPNVALQSMTVGQARQFLAKLDNDGSRNNATRYIANHAAWFDQQGWNINALLPARDNNLVLSDVTLFDKKPVSYWEKPAVIPQQASGTTRFDGQLIIQLENDSVSRESAVRLAGKHPGSILIQLDAQDHFQLVQGDLVTLQGKKNLRWQLVGHGRHGENTLNHQTLAGRTPEALAKQLELLVINSDFGTKTAPAHISLVGCSLADDTQQKSYALKFAQSLDQRIRPSSVKAYTTRITVNHEGRKQLTESGHKTTFVFNKEQNKWEMTEMPGLTYPAGEKVKPTLGNETSSAEILLVSVNRAEDFQQAMALLYRSRSLPAGEWLPVLGSLRENKGSHSLQFINRAEPELPARTLTTDDRRIIDFVQGYNEQLAVINKTYDYLAGKFIRRSNVTEPEAVHGLNSAFIIQTLIPWFSNQSRTTVAGDPLPGMLSTALQVHTWVNLAQMAHGGLEDGAKLIRLYQVAVSESQGVSSGLLSPLSHVSTGTGVALNIGSVVLDSIELAQAQNEAQRAIFGTQLAFDSAGLATAGGGIGAGFLGAPTVAALSGALAVPLLGLGIGVTALAAAYGQVTSDAQAVGSYFADLNAAYQQEGYRQVQKTAADGRSYAIMEPLPGAVISQLDLRNKHLTFDSQYIYRTRHGRTGSGAGNYFFWAGDMPQIIRNKSQAINIRDTLGHSASQQLRFKPNNDILVLPATPKSYLSYDYRTLPFATARNDRGFNVLRRLEVDHRFDYDFYIFPSEYIISRIKTDYVPTTVRVILDAQDRDIVIPALPDGVQGTLSYQLTGGGGEYRIGLQPGVSLSLQADNSTTQWVLDARHLGSADKATISQDGKQLHIGNVQITLAGASSGKVSLIDNHNDIFSVDQQRREITAVEVDAGRFNSLAALHEHLNKLTNPAHHNNPFVTVDNYQPSTETGHVGRAFYETSHDRIIYTNKPEAAEFLNQAMLAKTEGDKAWFYRDATLWQVDIASGAVLRQYLPIKFSGDDKEKISSYVMQGDGQLWLVVGQQWDKGRILYTYQVEEAALKLVAVDGDTELLAGLGNINSLHPDRVQGPRAGQWFTGNLTTPDRQVKGSLADVISLSGKVAGVDKHDWLLTDGKALRKRVRMNRIDPIKEDSGILARLKESNPGQQTLLADFSLAFVTAGNQAGYYFYSPQRHRLYFQPDNGLSGTSADRIAVDGIRSVFTVNQQLVALTAEGTLWLADNQGTVRLMGVTADWLHHHRENLIAHLSQLAGTTPTRFSTLLLQGLQDSSGKPVSAWYDSMADRVIQANTGLSTNNRLNYLGLNTDRRQAWIFDVDNQRLYRQTLAVTSDVAFNEKGVLSAGVVRAECWPGQKFLSAVRQEDKLRLETPEGAVFLLSAEADMMDRPVLIAWRAEGQQDDHIASAIESLRDDAELPQAIRLLSESNRSTAWYLPAERKICRAVGGPDADHFLHYLGQVSEQTASYIHDQTSGKLWSVSEKQSTMVGNYRFAHLEQGCLVLQMGQVLPNEKVRLPKLADTDRIAITGRSDRAHYLFDLSVLANYRQIVIDDRGENSVIQLPDASRASLLLQRNGRDLVLYHRASDTRIRIVNIEQAVQRGIKLKVGGVPAWEIDSLMKRMDILAASTPDTNQSEPVSMEDQLADFSARRYYAEERLVAANSQLPEAMATFRSFGEKSIRSATFRFPGSAGMIQTPDQGYGNDVHPQIEKKYA